MPALKTSRRLLKQLRRQVGGVHGDLQDGVQGLLTGVEDALE